MKTNFHSLNSTYIFCSLKNLQFIFQEKNLNLNQDSNLGTPISHPKLFVVCQRKDNSKFFEKMSLCAFFFRGSFPDVGVLNYFLLKSFTNILFSFQVIFIFLHLVINFLNYSSHNISQNQVIWWEGLGCVYECFVCL